jgi:hypothetical protein
MGSALHPCRCFFGRGKDVEKKWKEIAFHPYICFGGNRVQ